MEKLLHYVAAKVNTPCSDFEKNIFPVQGGATFLDRNITVF